MAKVFISYRRDDSKYQARDIYRAFRQVLAEDNVFMDVDSIPPGANFRKILSGWVGECEILLALIGPGWSDAKDPKTGGRRLDNPADFVRIEIAAALARDIPVVPVLLDGAAMPEADRLPDDLKELPDRHAEFVDYRTFDYDVGAADQEARRSPALGSRMGIRLPRREDHAVLVGQGDDPGSGELRWDLRLRGRRIEGRVSPENRSRGQLPAKSVGALSGPRQRVGVVRGLLEREL